MVHFNHFEEHRDTNFRPLHFFAVGAQGVRTFVSYCEFIAGLIISGLWIFFVFEREDLLTNFDAGDEDDKQT